MAHSGGPVHLPKAELPHEDIPNEWPKPLTGEAQEVEARARWRKPRREHAEMSQSNEETAGLWAEVSTHILVLVEVDCSQGGCSSASGTLNADLGGGVSSLYQENDHKEVDLTSGSSSGSLLPPHLCWQGCTLSQPLGQQEGGSSGQEVAQGWGAVG